MTDAKAVSFLLSPARGDGRRAGMLLQPASAFPLAERLHREGAPLGELFQFMSGLYFRGKLAYARAFARGAAGAGIRVITPGLGLVDPDRTVTIAELRAIATVGVVPSDPKFRAPLERDALALAASLPLDHRVVLLGSIATDKYLDVLQSALGDRLRFPAAFVGRGDMSRGGLLLRCVTAGEELDYVSVAGAVRHGPRPPRLTPIR